MRKTILFVLATVLLASTGSSYAAVGWAGQIWPTSGQTYLPTDNINVYVQVWKGGCTEAPGPCADLAAWLYFKRATDANYDSVSMSFNVQIGNNDEFVGTIPALATDGGVDELFYCRIYDSTDNTWYNGAQDQAGNNPPFTLHIQEGTSRDVLVTFRADMRCVNPAWYSNGVYFTGGFLSWQTCVSGALMADADNDGIWEGQWLFPGGSNAYHEYKFQRNDGACHWEGGPNKSFTIDDSNPTQILDVNVWHCESWGPGEITGAGSFCVSLCCCDHYLDIPLNTVYDIPRITGLSVVPGCSPEQTGCDDPSCAPGAGDVQWAVVQIATGQYVLRLCIVPGSGHSGCFCITIDQILPVELGVFTATAGDRTVNLRWTTLSETDNDYFEIRRNGEQIVRVASRGNTPTGHEYLYTDAGLTNGATYSYALFAVDLSGNLQELAAANAVPGANAGVAEDYALGQNFPNPFNPATSIGFSLKETGLVTITIYNAAGQKVATVLSETMSAGSHTVVFDAAGLPSGIYVYRMQAGEFRAAAKMVLLK